MSFEGEAGLEALEGHEVQEAVPGRAADLSILARSSLLNFVGGVSFGLFTFLWLAVVARGWGPRRAGTLLEAVALFTIATGLVVLGSEESVVRAISRLRASGMVGSIRRTLAVALVPVSVFGVVVAVVVWATAPQLARLVGGRSGGPDFQLYIRMFAPALPFTSLYLAVLAATRAFGTMVPTVAIERVGRAGAQAAAAGLVIAAGMGIRAMALGWELPFVVGFAIAGWELAKLVRHAEGGSSHTIEVPPIAEVAREFWRFSGFRGVASIFQTTSLWIDTLIVGALASASATAIYTTSSRMVRLGSLVLLAIIQAMAPQIGELLARRERGRTEHVYRVSTWWLMILTWPLYLTMAIFAPLLLRIFGSHFPEGAKVVATMAAAMLLSTAMGPVDMVLLMGGKSGWNLVNTVVSLATDVILNFLLVPRLGIEGAAIAWAASVALNNVLPYAEVRALLHITPFAPPGAVPGVGALISYGVLAYSVRLVVGSTVPGLAIALVLGTGLYVVLLRRFGSSLEFTSLRSILRLPTIGRSNPGPSR